MFADKNDIIAINAVLLRQLKLLTNNWSYIDFVDKFQNPDGTPLLRYFRSDNMHWTQAAYDEVVYPALKADLRYTKIIYPQNPPTSVDEVIMNQKDSSKYLWHAVKLGKLSVTRGDNVLKQAKLAGKKINLLIGNRPPADFSNLQSAFPNHIVFTRGVSGFFTDNLTDYRDDLGVEFADNLLIYIGEDDYLRGSKLENGEIACGMDFILKAHVRLQTAITYWKNKYPNLKVTFIRMEESPKLWRPSHGGNWQIGDFNLKKMQPFVDARADWMKTVDVNSAMKIWVGGKAQLVTNFFLPNSIDLSSAGYARWTSVITPFLVR